jgi:hypothetical protein
MSNAGASAPAFFCLFFFIFFHYHYHSFGIPARVHSFGIPACLDRPTPHPRLESVYLIIHPFIPLSCQINPQDPCTKSPVK